VHVTGTRFAVEWSAAAGVLAVTLREGSVVVDGGVLGPGVPLRAGQQLRVGVDGVVRTTEASAALATTPPAAAPAAERPGPDWRALAERGAYREALRAAEQEGLEAQLATLDARGLLALGDVARYAGAPETATRTFRRLAARFPRHRLAADAVFSLGRLSFEAGQPARAATWFARYVRRWPDGPLAEQAAGRLVESAARAGDRATARQAARAYLQRSPEGTYASSARSILDQPGPTESPVP
jgi:tetratricopeptide (TPR) repeat protein